MALLSLGALAVYAFTQTTSYPDETAHSGWEGPFDAFESLEESSLFLLLDRDTWNVFDPSNPERDLSGCNTMEARMERYKATLGFEFPDEYLKQFPPSEEEIAIAEEARRTIENPPTLDAVLKMPRSEEEQQDFEESLRSILEPMTMVVEN
jgi:hypothetical protein